MSHMSKDLVPTVYVVDDDASVRESLSSLLRSAGMQVEVFASALAFLDHKNLQAFACVVLDVRMPGLDGFGLQERLSSLGRDIPIIFITGHGEVPLAVRAMRAGAIDFLNKPFEDTDLLNAIELALSHLSSTSHERLALTELRGLYDTLTSREKQIMAEVALGKLNKAIAFDLGVTESTVKVHRHNVMHKMQLKSVPALTMAMQRLKSAHAISS
ncbi:MAG: response regulator [Rhodoferax sp.]|nr:response regulator [Rhodoferax sp.]